MSSPLIDVVERLVGKGRHVVAETCALNDTVTVRQWLAELDGQRDHQVSIFRSWGVLTATGEKNAGATILFSDGEHSSYAVPPGSGDDTRLSSAQIESVMLEALTSSVRPSWPNWI